MIFGTKTLAGIFDPWHLIFPAYFSDIFHICHSPVQVADQHSLNWLAFPTGTFQGLFQPLGAHLGAVGAYIHQERFCPQGMNRVKIARVVVGRHGDQPARLDPQGL